MPTESSLKKPSFIKDPNNDFFSELRQQVNQVLAADTRDHYLENGLKVTFFYLMYFLLYASLYTLGSQSAGWLFLLYVALGILMIVIFLNVVHEAAHNALFRSKKANEWLMYTLEMFGTNNFVWKVRHIRLHHPYPNIPTWDCDIEQSNLVKIFPDAPPRWYHKYQHLYLPPLYLLYTLNWILIRDFKDFFGRKRIVRQAVDIPRMEFFKLFLSKVFYFTYMLVLPMIFLPFAWYVVAGAFLTMHLCASAMGLVALLSTHAGENAHWTYPDEQGKVDQTFIYHQMVSTNDFSPESRLIFHIYGGFNHHVAHHLFPNISYIHYPKITPLIREYAARYNMPYHVFTFREAFLSHFYLLRNNAVKESIFEETM